MDDDDRVTGFMCKTDWENEVRDASNGATVYPDEDDLRTARKCVAGCGIVEVELRLVRVVQEAKAPRPVISSP